MQRVSAPTSSSRSSSTARPASARSAAAAGGHVAPAVRPRRHGPPRSRSVAARSLFAPQNGGPQQLGVTLGALASSLLETLQDNRQQQQKQQRPPKPPKKDDDEDEEEEKNKEQEHKAEAAAADTSSASAPSARAPEVANGKRNGKANGKANGSSSSSGIHVADVVDVAAPAAEPADVAAEGGDNPLLQPKGPPVFRAGIGALAKELLSGGSGGSNGGGAEAATVAPPAGVEEEEQQRQLQQQREREQKKREGRTLTQPPPRPDVAAQTAEQQQEQQQQQRADAAGAGQAAAATPQAATSRNLVFVAAEVAPWSKTGGLGDVMGSLPIALAARGHRVMVVAPRYAPYPEAIDTGVRVTPVYGAEVGYFHYRHRGVDFVFVDHPSYPRPGGLYADEHGVYGDNQFRFMLLALAGLEAPLQLPLNGEGLYGQECVFIANDWHAALVPVFLAAKYRANGTYVNARSVMAIHNLRHQGVFPPGTFADLNLPASWYPAVEYQYPPHLRQGSYAEEGRSVNLLKGGITVADRLVTVSPGYAVEIRSWLGGWGLDGMLNARGPVLDGIVNGIDDDDWNPAVDKHLPANYDASSLKRGKAACKRALQEELGLPVDPDVPLVAFIGRLDYQKGADIVLQAAPWLMSQGAQLVCLGTGSTDLESGLRWLEAAYRDQARGWVGFNNAMAHKITAAADILLMPSRFEPCGLNQLYAMAYGAVPVAHATGGLKDTVIDFNPMEQTGTGWTFATCDAAGLMHATGLALYTYREHPADFEALQRRGMLRDSSWNGAAQQYEQLFEWALMDAPYAQV